MEGAFLYVVVVTVLNEKEESTFLVLIYFFWVSFKVFMKI